MAARILIIEDNATNLELMVYLLRAYGHSTISASDGESGVVLARQHRPDLILMDIQMPECDGVEATRLIRALSPPVSDIPIIAATAHALSGDRDEALAAGCNDYDTKPIEFQRLLSKIESVLQK